MRKRFEIQYELGVKAIEDLKITTKSRDELPAVLRGLQYIYVTPEINEEVFSILEKEIKLSKRGCTGLSLWEILVLGVVRLTLDINYDRLEHIANNDMLVRKMLGVKAFSYLEEKIKTYPIQTIKDNVKLLREETIDKISRIVVESGHSIKKKDNGVELGINIKVDSYVLESNVHFPTDYNLLWDSCRKSIDLIERIQGKKEIKGWRKYSYWYSRIKNSFKSVCTSSKSGGKNREERFKKSVNKFLTITESLIVKLHETSPEITKAAMESEYKLMKLKELEYFELMITKHNEMLKRRVIYGETIPHEEKIFSLFETYTEWINKGKSGNRIELGLRLAISTDQYGFILDRLILMKKTDVQVAIPISEKLKNMFGTRIKSISFDKGFWSKENYDILSKITDDIILPKRGKLNKEEYEREHNKQFKMLRNRHSSVESNINSLEHHGLNKCPDRGITHFRNYSALGCLSYNLHLLGNLLLEKDRKRQKKLMSKAA
jgi:transposase, IS5 family